MSKRLLCGLMFGVVAMTGCADGGAASPTAPTSAMARPKVDGVYSGTFTLSVPGTTTAIVCPASTVVTQADSAVSLAPIALSGTCDGMTVPIGVLSIDASGAFNSTAFTQTVPDATCGEYQTLGSGGFIDREMRLSVTFTSSACRGYNFTISLMRAG